MEIARSQGAPMPAAAHGQLWRANAVPAFGLDELLDDAVFERVNADDREAAARLMRRTLVLYVSGTPAGYVELEVQPENTVEVAYFGLLPRFIGQRLGGYLLGVGVERAWAQGARRVWVHTCSLDGPNALANYQARGFRVYDRRVEQMDLPRESPGPWPGAGVTG